jgi:hypothetical protein
MRKILDEGARVTQQLAADGAAADPTNAEKRDRAEKYRCPARCRLYFRGTITVDGYCEQGAGEAVLSGRLCKYDGHIECLEITVIN